jgi:hypothetical protein
MGSEETVFATLYALAILATAIMLYLTEEPMPEPPTDEQRVFAMLDDAQTNGYDISTWTADDIVADLLAYADLKEGDTEESLKPHVIAWQNARGHNVVAG